MENTLGQLQPEIKGESMVSGLGGTVVIIVHTVG